MKSMFNLNELEQYARRRIPINQYNPSLKIIVTLVYIILLTSVNKYHLSRTLLFGIYPILLISISNIPAKALFGKLFIPAVLSISLGIFNPFFDKQPILHIGTIIINGGVISLITLFVKAMLSICATLLLVSTTTIQKLGLGLENLKVPKSLVVLLLLMYRYISVLLDEVNKTMEAYQLRSAGGKGIHFKTWGSLVGQIMIRSYRRSEEIYNAMLLRGYSTGGM
jgi:cobalt/nickel transport system permease protein